MPNNPYAQLVAELRFTLGKMEVALASLAQSIVWTDGKGRIQWANASFCTLLGKTKIEILGQEIITVLPLSQDGTILSSENHPLQSHQENEENDERLYTFLTGDEEFLLQVSQEQLQSHSGIEDLSYIITISDVTEQKEAERLAMEQELRLAHAARLVSLGEMASGIAHELSQPLQYIVLALGRLERQQKAEQWDGTKVAGLLTESLKQTSRATTILDQMLRLSRDDKTRIELNPIDVPPLLEQSLILVRHHLKAENIKLETSLSQDLPKIMGNAHQLEQVFINLLRNAIQAIEAQEATRQIFVSVRLAKGLPNSPKVLRFGSWVEIEIADTGTGIPKENLARLGEPFFTTKPPGKGTGLGLAVSLEIIEAHGGIISFSNREEGGTRVILQFPGL